MAGKTAKKVLKKFMALIFSLYLPHVILRYGIGQKPETMPPLHNEEINYGQTGPVILLHFDADLRVPAGRVAVIRTTQKNIGQQTRRTTIHGDFRSRRAHATDTLCR